MLLSRPMGWGRHKILGGQGQNNYPAGCRPAPLLDKKGTIPLHIAKGGTAGRGGVVVSKNGCSIATVFPVIPCFLPSYASRYGKQLITFSLPKSGRAAIQPLSIQRPMMQRGCALRLLYLFWSGRQCMPVPI